MINYSGLIIKWENGVKNPSVESLLKIRFFLGFRKEKFVSPRSLNISIKLSEVFQKSLWHGFLSQKYPGALADL